MSNLISNDYLSFLKRAPSPGELSGWSHFMNGKGNELQMEALLLASPEYYQEQASNPTSWISSLYLNVLNRVPSTAEMTSWDQLLQNGGSRTAVATALVTGAEVYGLEVTSTFEQLLGRDPEPAEMFSWVSQMQQGLTPSQMLADVAGSPEYIADQTVTPETPVTFGPATGLHFEFASENSLVAAGYTRVPVVNYTATRNYGWLDIAGIGARERPGANPLTSNLETGTSGTFVVGLPDGDYTVEVTLGDAEQPHADVSLWMNGVLVGSGLSTTAGQFIQPTATVQVTNGQLAVYLSSADSSFAIDALDITPTSLTLNPTVNPSFNPAGALTVNPATLANVTANTPYSATFSATGGSGNYTFAVTSGSLPAGLTSTLPPAS